MRFERVLVLSALLAGCTTVVPTNDARKEFSFPFVHDYSVVNHVAFDWRDEFLDTDPRVYSQELAGPLSALAACVYGYRLDMDVETLAGLGFDKDRLFRRYGNDLHYDDPVWGRDQIGFTFATKRAFLGGEMRDVLFVLLRGTFGRTEWVSNMNACNAWGAQLEPRTEAQPPHHEGFNRAADCVAAALAAYIASNRIDLATAKVVVTGHSRGAAVANILGARLDEASDGIAPSPFAGVRRDNIFVYTFATPNSVMRTDVDVSAPRYDNIFNIINPEDMVPLVPILKWNARRYGHDLHLHDYGELGMFGALADSGYNEMKDAFREMCGYEYWHTLFGTNSTAVVPALLGAIAPTLPDLYSVPPAQRATGNMTSIHSILETVIYRSMQDPVEEERDISLGGDVGKLSKAYANVSDPVESADDYFYTPDGRDFSRQPGFFDIPWRLSCMHATQTYIAWMKAAERHGPAAVYKNPPFTKQDDR